MPTNYLATITKYHPTEVVYTTGDPKVYASIQWTGQPITQAVLDAEHVIEVKTAKLIELSIAAGTDITSGFKSDALGFPHWYDSELEDQINLIGAVASGSAMVFSARDYDRACQVVNVSGLASINSPTGYANNSTLYTAEVKIDGTSTYFSFPGQIAQTYGEFINLMNLDVDFSALGSAEFLNGDICIRSKTYGKIATVEIIDTNVFSSLGSFQSIMPKATGLDGKDNPVKKYNLHTNAQLLQVINDGKDFKLTMLQKFNVKKGQVLAATTENNISSIIWE